jgi:hypothetical protein
MIAVELDCDSKQRPMPTAPFGDAVADVAL